MNAFYLCFLKSEIDDSLLVGVALTAMYPGDPAKDHVSQTPPSLSLNYTSLHQQHWTLSEKGVKTFIVQ